MTRDEWFEELHRLQREESDLRQRRDDLQRRMKVVEKAHRETDDALYALWGKVSDVE